MITDLGRWFQWKDFLFAQVIPNTVVFTKRNLLADATPFEIALWFRK